MARASCWTCWRGKGCAATRARRHVSVGIPQVWFSTVVCTTTKGSQLSPLPHTHTTTTTTRIPPHPHRPAAAVQLVVTCEVCRRPATKECWTCGMQICEFCTLKRHWKVPESPTHAASSCLVTLPPPHTWTQFITCDLLLPPRCLQGTFPLHWPLVNSDHMRERLAKRELERKRIEDADRQQLEDPNFRRGWRLAGCTNLGRCKLPPIRSPPPPPSLPAGARRSCVTSAPFARRRRSWRACRATPLAPAAGPSTCTTCASPASTSGPRPPPPCIWPAGCPRVRGAEQRSTAQCGVGGGGVIGSAADRICP